MDDKDNASIRMRVYSLVLRLSTKFIGSTHNTNCNNIHPYIRSPNISSNGAKCEPWVHGHTRDTSYNASKTQRPRP
jgi:hypothetical protein